ncbi:MAG TPA: TlpA disulfide reductase family protein [Actinomycetota bacterium]|nr:TlpA disulfide reductase family protein [Actinomycetota bacterium]
MRFRHLLLLASLVLLPVACGDGEGTNVDGRRGDAAVAARNATSTALLPTDAAALPEFDVAAYDELLGQLRGTPILVNFWGSWCGPCRDEAPDLAAAHREFGDDVQFLGVDILDARESARAFIAEFGWRYPSVFDPPAAIRDGLGLLGQPVTLFYDAEGALVDRWAGPIPRDELDARITAILRG